MLNLRRKQKIWLLSAATVIVIVLLGFQVVSDSNSASSKKTTNNSASSTATVSVVKPSDIRQSSDVITVSGQIKGQLSSRISTQTSGVISEVPVAIGDYVTAGQLLAEFENDSQQASLRQAQANLQSQKAKLAELTSGSRSQEIKQSRLAVQRAKASQDKAKQQLLNTDLQAYVSSGSNNVRSGSLEAPTISGNYNHSKTGKYRISLYRSDTKSGYSFRYQGLESGVGTVNTESPEPLGDRGLYIQFPDDFASSRLLEWVVPIPNTRSSQYIAAKDNKRQADIQLEEAQSSLNLTQAGARSEQIDAQKAQAASAEANVDTAREQLDKTKVTAPFSGRVQSVSVDPGEYTGVGQPVAKIINQDQIEITTNVGVEVAEKLSVGDSARIGEDGLARIAAVAPGVSNESGNVAVKLTVNDRSASSLTPGSYTDVTFSVGGNSQAARNDRRTLPLSAVQTTGNGSYVFAVKENNRLERVSVTLGEITGGRVTVTGSLPDQLVVADINAQELSAGQQVIIANNE